MDPISFAASVAALIGVLSKTKNYLSAVKNASAERKALFQEAAGLLPILISLQNKVEEHESFESCSEGIRVLATEYGALDQLREALSQLATILNPGRSGIKNIADSLSWQFDKKLCGEILEKIERVKSWINLALQDDIHKLVHAIKADTAGIDLVKERMSDLHIREKMKERNDVLAWFSPLNFFQWQQDIFRRRAEHTGEWLIDVPAFQSWVAGSECTLCCWGFPGVGKSILASVVVDYLRNIFKATYSFSVAAAYCNFKDKEIQSPENLLAGLCVQVLGDSEPLPEILVQLHGRHASKRTRPSLKDVLDVFKEAMKHFETTYLIVDALDECSSEVRGVLLQELKSLQPRVRLLVTTRPPINYVAEKATIEIRASRGDLEKYIKSRIAESNKLSSLLRGRPKLLGDVCNNVIDKAGEMFLAATLHMDSLATKMSVKTLKQAIDRLPSTLNRLYDEAFRRIDDQNEDDREFASKALRWVAYTYRPLTVPELEQALAIEPRGRDLDPDAAPDIAFVLEACAGLLIVDKETEQVRLVHYTAQDYLDTLLTSRYQEAHASIAGDCITYLNYDVFQLLHFDDEPDAEPDAEPDDEPDDGEPDNEPDNKPDNEPDVDSDAESEYESYDGSDDERHVKARKGMKHTYYLLSYASEYWAKHCRMAGQRVELGAQLYNFLASDPQIRLFTRDSGLWFEPSPADLRKTNGIAIAACYGICDALRRLLQQNEVDINWKTHQEHSALHLAAMNDEVISVEILLDYGADIECNGQYERTPLMCAIECNSTNTAWLLVERGAATSNEAFNSVHWASPIPFLQLLLNHGADVNARSSYGTQLMGRTREDDVETVRWLLEKGAAVDRRNSLHGQTALFEAGRSGSVDMVELLLVHGANYSIIDDKGNTILHAACKEGKVHLVRRFLDLGIPIDATNFWGDTPSRLAARKGDIECLELLLANKADVDKAGHLGRTPLVAAILEGSTKAVQPLLNAGAKVDLQDGQGCTALHHAVCKRDTSAISLLLKHHASCGARSSLDLSLRHVSDYVNPESGLIIWGDQGGLRFVNAQALRNSESSRSLELMLRRLITDECRAWKSGMTALDIACVLDDAECIDLLKPLTGSITESTIMTPGDYLCELFGFSSVAELEEEIERREQVLHKKHERMREEMRAERRREREERNQELVERGESEESSSSERW